MSAAILPAILGAVAAANAGVLAAGRAEAGCPMVDLALDDPAKPWCYFTHPPPCFGVLSGSTSHP